MKKILSLGLVRGLLWQIAGTAAGALLVTGIRALMGLNPWGSFLFTEPAWVVGALTGVIAFVWGVGALTDWFKWALGEETPEHREDPPGWEKYFGVSLDHKVIGIQYTVTAILLLLVGGLFALIFRLELAASGMQFLSLQLYNTLMSLHGIVMIAGILLGVAGVMNYLVPMLVGAHDMAFPRLNAFSYWIAPPAAIVLLSSLALGGFDTGWTGYPPLSTRSPVGIQMFFVGVWVVGWSSILGGLNLIATVMRLRAKGMTAFRMPILVWASVATSLISLTATQLIGLSFQLVMFQRLLGMGFFDPAKGGNPILFQHLFWFYSHPAVYVFILPGLGVVSELLPVFVRKPLFGYRWVAMSSLGIALVGFLVWAHHMFTSGMNEYLRVPFMYSTLLVAVPTGVKFFSWVATLWKGKIETPTGLSQMKLRSRYFKNYPISGNQKPLRAFFTHIWGYFVQCDYTLLRMTDHYHLLTPLLLKSGQAVLVDRGWIPADGNASALDWQQYNEGAQEVSVRGILRLGQPSSRNAPEKGLWVTVDLEQIGARMPYRLFPVYLQLDPQSGRTQPPVPYQPVIELTEGPHLGYAIQWFTFAAILLLGYPFYLRKQEQVPGSNHRQPPA